MKHNLYPSDAMKIHSNQNGESEGINPTDEWFEKYTPGGKHETIQARVENLKKVGEKPEEYIFILLRRNPWDLMVSWYFWTRKNVLWDRDSFTEFIINESAFRRSGVVNDVNGCLNYNTFFVEMNNQLQDLNGIFARWGIQFDDMPHKNKSAARKDTGYRQYYDDNTRSIVKAVWKDYIEYFDYQF